MISIYESENMRRADILSRKTENIDGLEEKVKAIIADVKENGDKAVRAYTEKFDRVALESFKVTENEITEALNTVDADFIATLKIAADNIREFHGRQVRKGFEIERAGGAVLGQRVLPLERVGLYVPGGTAAYPSTVLMNAVPAVIAGVKEIIMVTPPSKDGKIKAEILAAATIAGVNQIYKIGGAQAVAALSFGTESVPKVDKIVGPGNIFVATAKRLVYGIVDIDMIAGPSEILIIADKSGRADYIAADLLSQAEHDVLASSVLITDSKVLAYAVQGELEKQLPNLKRAEIARKSIEDNGKIIITPSIEEAVDISNEIAPEHLELCVDEPFKTLEKIKNAGSVFLGEFSPEPLGDYMAGTNHTLPTGGTARFSSPLSVDDFVKKTSYIFYNKDALGALKDRIIDFAGREGLQAHAESIAMRFRG